MKKIEGSSKFTHLEYRKAKIVHLINKNKEEEFLFQGKAITKEKADAITQRYMEEKKINKVNE